MQCRRTPREISGRSLVSSGYSVNDRNWEQKVGERGIHDRKHVDEPRSDHNSSRDIGTRRAVVNPKGMGDNAPAVLEIWEMASGKLRVEYKHKGHVNCLAFAPDSLTLRASRQAPTQRQ
jgi:hypothetical protein